MASISFIRKVVYKMGPCKSTMSTLIVMMLFSCVAFPFASSAQVSAHLKSMFKCLNVYVMFLC